MVREIIIYPDKRLKKVSEEVRAFDKALHALLDDMYETMIAKNGVGLAAIQIAVPQRVLIINVPVESEEEQADQPKENTLEMVNPEIIEKKGSTMYQEGCLSVPGIYEDVERYEYAKVNYFDRHGNPHTIENDEFLAIAIQHEVDHLDGKVFVEKLSYIKRKKFEKEWRKRQKSP
ncbi:MAG: peptide deformylase [Campylobacterota bacterium]|nr:peptide deformylase [Campylobacterota bacterium]